jgi:hypothetical protein
MVRLVILDQDDKRLTLQEVPSAGELLVLVEQARNVIRDCERLTKQMGAKSGTSLSHQIPYSS